MVMMVNFTLCVFYNRKVEERLRFERRKLCTFYFYVNYNSVILKCTQEERICQVVDVVAFLTNF